MVCARLFALLFLSSCLADHPVYINSAAYNNGSLGAAVNQTFQSSPVTAPVLNSRKPFAGCDDGSYLFIAPRGEVGHPTLYILDHNGSLVWTPSESRKQKYNLQVQQYKGEQYLTWWQGEIAVGGHGDGSHYMLDKHYDLYRKFDKIGGFGADLHAFTITARGTFLATMYEMVQRDMPGRHHIGGKGWVWDCLFAEVELETAEVLFQWRASEHFEIFESYAAVKTATRSDPWDWFHINTVDQDAAGNYLISSRHLRTVAKVSAKTGEVLWQLGGKKNSFTDLSSGAATSFIGQHDARWSPDGTAITLFDNQGDWYEHTKTQSQGLRIAIDVAEMTARLETAYIHPDEIIYSVAQGSYQSLPNSNVLIGYGNNGALAEFSANGTLLCDALFEPAEAFGSGDVQSYRDLKFPWTGIPRTKPSVAVEHGIVYVSWLGATEVQSWLVQGSRQELQGWKTLGRVEKAGFETGFALQTLRSRYVRVTALDAGSQALAESDLLDLGDEGDSAEDGELGDGLVEDVGYLQVPLSMALLAMLIGVVLACVLYRKRVLQLFRRRQQTKYSKLEQMELPDMLP